MTKKQKKTKEKNTTNQANGVMTKVRNCDQLRRALEDGAYDFLLQLAAGCVSRKWISLEDDGRFRVENHIDGTIQTLTDKELYTKSNIGKAMRLGAFVYDEREFNGVKCDQLCDAVIESVADLSRYLHKCGRTKSDLIKDRADRDYGKAIMRLLEIANKGG